MSESPIFYDGSRCLPAPAPPSRPGLERRSRPPILLATVLVASWGPAATARAQTTTPFTIPAVRTATPPTIDGAIGVDEWRDSARAADFIQFQPNRGEPAELETQVMVLYDDAQLWNDDSVQVYIDTFHDGRSGYSFMTNVLGTQLDGRLAEDGTSSDETWDAPWESATQQTDFGYTTEISIPFGALQYAAGDDTTWGINFARSRRRTLDRSYWSGPVDHWGRMSQAGDLVGLDVPPLTRRHQVIPYALSETQEGRSPDASFGLDVRYALTPQTSAYGTLNPDFATIEADQKQINLTRFELNLREKRQFFLEGQELFNQRIQTFYSRRIGDISGGAKVLGKQGAWTFAALSTRGDLQGSGNGASYTVARVRRDVASRSNIGFLLANRAHDGRHQRSAEIDATLFFTKTFGFTGQFVKSYGDFGSGAVERVACNSNYNFYWGQTGTLRSWKVDESLDVDWRNRWSTAVSHTEGFKRFEKDFRNRQTKVEIGYNTRSYESVRGGFAFGRNFDADFQLWTAEATYTVTETISAEYKLQRLDLDPDPKNESTWIHVIRANQFFTPDLFLRVFFQTNSAIDRRNMQAVFVYRYLPPFGTLQVAFQRGTAEFGERSNQGNTVFMKITTVI